MIMQGSPSTGIKGMGGTMNDIGEKSGFQTEGYIVKKGTPQGESAMFNKMPPGMDITNQDVTDQRSMPFRKLTELDYPGDGAFSHRDLPE
jgi:hypothetical protein